MPTQSEINGRFGVNTVGNVVFWNITAESSNARTVNMQFYSRNGREMQAPCAVLAYLSSSAAGDTVEPSSGTLSVAAGTDGAIAELATDDCFLMIPESDGDMDLTITQTSGADTFYLCVVMPDGSLVISQAITYT